MSFVMAAGFLGVFVALLLTWVRISELSSEKASYDYVNRRAENCLDSCVKEMRYAVLGHQREFQHRKAPVKKAAAK